MRVRPPLAILAVLVATFAGGMASPRWTEREAIARQPQTATMYVPPDGLLFRAPDGRAIARLSYDAHGGVFEVIDDDVQMHWRPVTIVPAQLLAGAERTVRLFQKVQPDRQPAHLRDPGAQAARDDQPKGLGVERDALSQVRDIDVDQQIHNLV